MKRHIFVRHGWKIVLLAAIGLPLFFGGARRALLSNRNDVKEWLPSSFQETKDLQWFQKHFPSEEFVLVSWEGCTLDDPRVEELIAAVSGKDSPSEEFFSRAIIGPRLVEQLTTSPVNLPREKAIDRLVGSVIGPDRKHTCVVFTLSEAGAADIKGSIAAIVDSAKQQCGITYDQLHMGGPPVDNRHIDHEGERMLIRLGTFAGLIGLVLAWRCLKSFKLTLMVFVIALYGASISLALMKFTGATVSAVVLTMPALVYVLGISGAIHIVNYYRDALEHGDTTTAPFEAVAHGWLPCTIAAATTAIGLGSLCISDISPIKTFGLFSALGVISTLVLVLVLLPAMLQIWPVVTPSKTLSPSLATYGGRWRRIRHGMFQAVIDHHVAVTWGCMALLLFTGYGLTKMQTTVMLTKLFAEDHRIIKDYRFLEEHLGELIPMEVVLRVDKEKCSLSFLERMQLVSTIRAELEKIEDVGGTMATPTFSPELESLASRPRRRSGGLLGAAQRVMGLKDRKRIENNVRNKRLLKYRDEFLNGDFLGDSGDEELWRISARIGALNDVDYGLFVSTIREHVEPVIQQQCAKGIEGLNVTYTGIIPLVYKSQRTLLDNLFESFGSAFGLIAIVMMVVLRSPMAGLVAMLPNIFPAVVVFGGMCLMGIKLDIGAMMCASVALGVGVDDTIHFLTWFRRGLDSTGDRRQAIMQGYERCATAMTQTTIISGLGLSVFALSSFMPTQRFGYLMVTLLTAALVGDLLLLPAILAGPLGRVFDRKNKLGETDQPATTIHRDISQPQPAEQGATESTPGTSEPREKILL